MRKILICLFVVLLWPLTLMADEVGYSVIDYRANHNTGTMSFAGTHAGQPFDGIFKEWYASINYTPEDISQSKIEVTIITGSAETGNPMFDGTIPQKDWFDVEDHTQANFVSLDMQKKDGAENLYSATGDLTIKGITNQVSFNFTMTDPNTAPVKVQATIPIERLAFNIGKESDPDAEWVGEIITVTLDLEAVAAE